MDNPKILSLGAAAYINQIDRIREGLRSLGVDLAVDFETIDYIYCNDPSDYAHALDIKNEHKNIKLIFNVLDVPPHLVDNNKYNTSRYPVLEYGQKRNFNIENLRVQLSQADAITCICKDVQQQLLEWCGVKSTVIYNPIKDVSFLGLDSSQKIINGKRYKHLFVGRACDPNKRFTLCYETMKLLGDSSETLAVVGTENPGWGDYYGVVSDEQLNYLYNSVDYLWLPSAFKSIGLPALEAVVTKTIPIVCNDDPAGDEFFNPIELLPESKIIAAAIKDDSWNRYAKDFVDKNSLIFYNRFNKYQIARNILSLCYDTK